MIVMFTRKQRIEACFVYLLLLKKYRVPFSSIDRHLKTKLHLQKWLSCFVDTRIYGVPASAVVLSSSSVAHKFQSTLELLSLHPYLILTLIFHPN